MDPPPDRGDSSEDFPALVAQVYTELHRLAEQVFRGQRPDHTLQPTALVNEAYMKLSSLDAPRWKDRQHFYRVAAMAMRQVLVNHARDRSRLKRGGGRKRVSLDEALVVTGKDSPALEVLDEALEALAAVDERLCRVVELRYFVGLNIQETAEALGVSPATVKNDWALARAWLLERMTVE